jgi:lipopolysaccharide export system protein LptA
MRSTDILRLLASALLLLVCAAGAALAQTESQSRVVSGLRLSGDQPIQIESDKLEVREQDNIAIFTGNVTVTQGPTVL